MYNYEDVFWLDQGCYRKWVHLPGCPCCLRTRMLTNMPAAIPEVRHAALPSWEEQFAWVDCWGRWISTSEQEVGRLTVQAG